MKKVFSICSMLFFAGTLFAAPRFTADFYKGDPASYLNKVVSLKINSATPSSFEAIKGYVSFHCNTAYKTERGGYMYVLVPKEKAKSFSRNYGEVKAKSTIDGVSVNIPTKDLKGKFVQIEWAKNVREYVLIAQ